MRHCMELHFAVVESLAVEVLLGVISSRGIIRSMCGEKAAVGSSQSKLVASDEAASGTCSVEAEAGVMLLLLLFILDTLHAGCAADGVGWHWWVPCQAWLARR